MYTIASAAVSLVMLSAITGTDVTTQKISTYDAPNQSKTTQTTGGSAKTKVVAAAAPVAPAPVMVSVQPGDSLTSIAEAHGMTYNRLFDANEAISDPNSITVGQQLRIPDPSEQLAARPLPTAAAATSTTKAYSSSVVAASIPVVGNDAKAFIYARESGNNPNSTSPNGCYGLGQDCNGVVRAQCGADYACQDAFFTNYAVNRYGGWEGAVAFWQANGWW